MNTGEWLDYMGDDASKWAAEFCKVARDHGHNIDEGWMIGWFANAIEHSYALRVRRAGELPNPPTTREELEALLPEDDRPVEILPNGEIHFIPVSDLGRE